MSLEAMFDKIEAQAARVKNNGARRRLRKTVQRARANLALAREAEAMRVRRNLVTAPRLTVNALDDGSEVGIRMLPRPPPPGAP